VHQAAALKDVELHALSLGPALTEREGLHWHTFDLLETATLHALFKAHKPDAIIHAAALADIDFCQSNQDMALRVNVGVTEEIAKLCGDNGVRMVVLSTDTVFDGKKSFYTEQDVPVPLNFYGETKVAAEQAVIRNCPNHVVTRLSLVMGLPMLCAGNSFLAKMLPVLEKGGEVGVPDNEIRTPVDVLTLTRSLLELAVAQDYCGFMHIAGCDAVSRWQMMQRVAVQIGAKPEQVIVRNPEVLPDRAPRPHDASLSNALARATLKTPMLTLDDAIRQVLANRPAHI
jgi:dTDP-4-dehydrorhamnose reductase